jgi:hypothetical protein
MECPCCHTSVERYRGQTIPCLLLNLAGLLVILGSAFIQSFDSVWYAALLLFEGVVALAVGLGVRSRSYVLVGVLGLVLNGLAQFSPAFAELPRWHRVPGRRSGGAASAGANNHRGA